MSYIRNANPNATNSELDAKIIKPFIQLTNEQRNELIQQFVELQVDNMDWKTLAQWVTEEMTDNFEKNYNDIELKEEIENYDNELYDELVDNVTAQTEEVKEVKQCIIDTNGAYAECVDHLVDSMEATPND